MNEIIEKIICEGVIKSDNEYGYMIKVESVSEINKLGYGLKMTKDGIGYFKY